MDHNPVGVLGEDKGPADVTPRKNLPDGGGVTKAAEREMISQNNNY